MFTPEPLCRRPYHGLRAAPDPFKLSVMRTADAWVDRVLELPTDGPLTLAVVADTHGRPHPTALALIRAAAPGAVLHAGDIGDLRVLAELAPLAPALHVVRGNIDPTGPDLPDALVLSLRRSGRERLRILLLHMGVDGPRILKPVRALARKAHADLVICGHSHVPLIAASDGLAVLNPGSIGPRRFGLPITLALIRIQDDGLAFEHLDCETGQRWSPRAARPIQ